MTPGDPNIWALDKHQSIRHLLLLLRAQLGEGAFVLDTDTTCDRRAVFLHHPQDPALRAYLYTLGQEDGRYGVHLEYPPQASATLLEADEHLQLPAVVALLAAHFDVARVTPLPGH